MALYDDGTNGLATDMAVRRRQALNQSAQAQQQGQVAQQSNVSQPSANSAEPGGVAGTTRTTQGSPAPAPTDSTSSSISGLGSYANQMLGWDATKLQAGKDDAKYKIGQVLSNFDPTKGITPDVVNALNGLGYGTFSGNGQSLALNGVTAAGTAAGLDPHDFTGDYIQNYTGTDPNDHSGAKWQYDWYDPNAGQPGAGVPAGGPLPTVTGGPSLGQQQFAAQQANADALQKEVQGISDLPTYTPSQISQFNYSDDPTVQANYQKLINNVLTTPVVSDEQQAAQNEKTKEAALQMEKDQLGQATQDAISRGVYGTSGAANATQQAIRQNTISGLLSNYRDEALNAATANRQGQENAAGLAENYLTGSSNRATSQYGAKVAGQTAQAAENQAGFQSQTDAIKFQLQRALAAHGIAVDDTQLSNAAAALAEQGREFNANNSLDQQKLAAQIAQFNSQMGYSYNALQASQQQALINQILGA